MLLKKTKRNMFEANGTWSSFGTFGYTIDHGLLVVVGVASTTMWRDENIRFFAGRVCDDDVTGVAGDEREGSPSSRSSIRGSAARRLPLDEKKDETKSGQTNIPGHLAGRTEARQPRSRKQARKQKYGLCGR